MNWPRRLSRFLFSPRGKIGRSAFVAGGTVLVAIKLMADFGLARLVFRQAWNPVDYVWSKSLAVRLAEHQSLRFDFTILCLAAPFAWMGVCLCAKRLRSAAGPVWLVVLFFVPVIKWFLFALLSVFPPRDREQEEPPKEADQGLGRCLPGTAWGSALAAIAITVAIGALLVLLSVDLFRSYGSTLFFGTPFCVGFLTTVLYNVRSQRTLAQSIGAALISLLFIGALLLAVATEGLICLAMAAPLALCETVLGCFVAHSLAATIRRHPAHSALSTLIVFPLLFLSESSRSSLPPLCAVTSEVVINAPPQQVWKHVVSFAEMPPPHEWIFRAGIAYPQRARIDGTGVGAIRHCIFSTGEFVEPITAWEEPSRLAFDVSAGPDPLTELSPYRNLRTPHLHGYFESKRGEFRLEPTADGGTLLRGTTWYTQKFEPGFYWRWWSDSMIRQIHLRVLRHIKSECEGN